MKEATHTRKGKIIIALDTGAVEDHKSVNAAKKASHKLQPAVIAVPFERKYTWRELGSIGRL